MRDPIAAHIGYAFGAGNVEHARRHRRIVQGPRFRHL
jgi:hypothetical protein